MPTNAAIMGWAALHASLALVGTNGRRSFNEGTLVGGFKLSQRAAVRSAYTNSTSWNGRNQMRSQLTQDAGVLPRNGWPPRADDLTVDHLFFKQKDGAPHWLLISPANLQPGVTRSENARRSHVTGIDGTSLSSLDESISGGRCKHSCSFDDERGHEMPVPVITFKERFITARGDELVLFSNKDLSSLHRVGRQWTLARERNRSGCRGLSLDP